MNQEKIYVLDFGGQYTQLIAKKVRQCNVFSEIKPYDISIDTIVQEQPKGIILSGGPESVYEPGAPLADKKLFETGIPILGICYGMQQINHLSGGEIVHGADVAKEYGETIIKLDSGNKLFKGLDNQIIAWMSHGDSIQEGGLAKDFEIIAESPKTLYVAAIENRAKKIYGVQFHPEVTHTPQGKQIISNFVHNICGCDNSWTMANYIEEAKKYVRETVGKNDVLCFVSGGVDSTFVAALLAKTEGIGKVYPVYIRALMRQNENEQVEQSLQNAGVENLISIKAENRFIQAIQSLEDPSDPEQKRKAIGNLFGQIMQETCQELKINPNTTFLAQGTLYTDLIESGKGVGKKAATIKSHHNVGCKFIEDMKAKGKVVEPNRLIFKDEIREAAKEIGLPPEIYERQPYPGPGLAIRTVNGNANWAITTDFYDISAKVKNIAEQEGMKTGYIVPVKTVGVQGDGRTYKYLAVLEGERDWTKIRAATKRIPQEVQEVNRIVYEVSNNHILGSTQFTHFEKPITTLVTKDSIDQLKEIDYEGTRIIDSYGFSKDISQTIFVLFGADPHNTGLRSAALRAVSTDDFMTVTPIEPVNTRKAEHQNWEEHRKKQGIKMTWECLDRIAEKLYDRRLAGAFYIDTTDKPPSTTCWE